MNRVYQIFFFLLSSVALSQDIDYLLSQDTLYIYFKEGSLQHKSEFDIDNDIQGKQIYYSFYLGDSCKEDSKIEFLKTNYLSYEKAQANINANIKIVKKSFLRKARRRIVSHNFFNSIGRHQFLKLFANKTFFIIDESEIKKRQIVMTEVKLNSFLIFGE